MAMIPGTVKARFTFHLTRSRSWSFTLPVARVTIGRLRLVDGEIQSHPPVSVRPAWWFGTFARSLRALAFIFRVRIDVDHHQR
jgi:hypothetical protein